MRKRVFLAALVAAFALRLFFVLGWPSTGSGDAPFYIELAWNWLKNGIYGFPVNGHLTPVDMRVPGYPTFLAAIFLVSGKSQRAVMLAQAAVDVATCLVVALMAAKVAPERYRQKAAIAGLWLAALCPFLANYSAVVLTEVLTGFLTAGSMLMLLETPVGSVAGEANGAARWLLAGVMVGFGTLVRPETPLLLVAAAIVLIVKWRAVADWPKLIRAGALLGCGLLLPLLPWAARNWQTLHEVQFLAPAHSELPGEVAPVGFDAWTGTWLWRYRDVYLVNWNLDDAPIRMEDLPPYAFDSSGERERVAALFAEYNATTTLTTAEDYAFGEIARERTTRGGLRTYLKVPLLRSVAMWLTPRIELLPYSGHIWPLANVWNEDPADVLVTCGFGLLNVLFIAAAVAGAWIARGRPGLSFLLIFIALRTAFFAKFVEAPEPRYMLECFPAVLALAAQVWTRNATSPRPARDES